MAPFATNETFTNMSYNMYKKLGTCRNFLTVWSALNLEVIPKILGQNLYCVPTLTETGCFEMFSVFVKDKKKCCGCCGKNRPQTMRYVGNLRDMIDPDRGSYQIHSRALNVEEVIMNIPEICLPTLRYHYIGYMGNTRKEVHLEIGGLKRIQSWLPIIRKDDICLRSKITNGKTVYVVDVTYVASYLRIQTYGGFSCNVPCHQDGTRWEFTNNVTIAFQFLKFKCDGKGNLEPFPKKKKKKKEKKPKARKCTWILPSGTHTADVTDVDDEKKAK